MKASTGCCCRRPRTDRTGYLQTVLYRKPHKANPQTTSTFCLSKLFWTYQRPTYSLLWLATCKGIFYENFDQKEPLFRREKPFWRKPGKGQFEFKQSDRWFSPSFREVQWTFSNLQGFESLKFGQGASWELKERAVTKYVKVLGKPFLCPRTFRRCLFEETA